MTNFIIRPRQGGKTTEAITWAQQNGGTIIVPSAAQAKHLLRPRPGMERPNFFVLTINEFRDGRARGRKLGPVVIDDLDLMWNALGLSDPPEVVTATGVVVPPRAEDLRGITG